MPQSQIPSYRHHHATGQAVVVLGGRSIYLGKFGSPESRAKYDRVIARYLTTHHEQQNPGKNSPARPMDNLALRDELRIDELVQKDWHFAKGYHVKDGCRPTGEQSPLKLALRILCRHLGDARAAEFGPLARKALRASSDDGSETIGVRRLPPRSKRVTMAARRAEDRRCDR